MANTIHEIAVKNAQGKSVSLSEYKGKALLLVNVASKCGFTKQYTGLEELNKKYAAQGLVVMGFPCNQFGAQEQGSDEEIQNFCRMDYGVTFPVMAKIEVNGKGADPLYQFLKGEKPGILGTEAIKWNFTKFLVSRDGKVIKRYSPDTEPAKIAKDIEAALA